MAERKRVIGIGAAYIEGKIRSSEVHLPSRRSQLSAFLEAHKEFQFDAGGSIPNIMTSFIRLSAETNIRLFCCVGKDELGKLYAEQIDRKLGKPKINNKKPTGVWVGVYNNGLTESLDFYGAAHDFTVSRRELRRTKNELFITDLDSCSVPHTLKEIKKTLNIIIEDNGIFALSLGHIGTEPSTKDQKQIQEITLSLIKTPDIVFGNEYELLYITGEKEISSAMSVTFPSSRLVVVTQAEKGTIIRFNEKIFSVPAHLIPKENIIDDTGAGDSYMGSMLATLSRTPYEQWQEQDIIQAAEVAHFASALVIQSMHSQVTPDQAQQILKYSKIYKVKNTLRIKETW